VSLALFQATLARLVCEPGFRERVRGQGQAAALEPGLTLREQRRLREAAADPGIEVTAMLIDSFRLGKILALLPLTRTLLGDAGLAREVRAFWATQPPRSFYALDECVAFCDFLVRRPWRRAYTDDVVGLERAMLALRRVRPEGAPPPPPQEVRFRYDPEPLLKALLAGRRPRRVPPRPRVVVAHLGEDGSIDWAAGPVPARPRAASAASAWGAGA
jgi:hypothetical protein